MTKKEPALCPFSKPIIGQWCQCEHARLSDRCAGKMLCRRKDELLPSCQALVELLKQNSRFVIGITDEGMELTHAQTMKIRCGGLQGMQRLLQPGSGEPPKVRDIIAVTEKNYESLENFPFSDIIPDIQVFTHRKKI
ncbi:MAG: hypothetical protein PVJ63_10720 [Thioalkalispiraceae bacterium]|jgi:hypothetical protein